MSRARDLADLGGSADAGGLTGRNMVINGAMTVHQRTGTISSSGTGPYSLDRFRGYSNGGGVFSMEQSTTVPNNTFTNSLKCTVTTNDTSVASGDFYALDHRVEGYNIIQTGFGTSDAVPVTLSFWVRSSVTGIYSAYIYNADGTRVYVFTYTISAADTWQKVENTFTGETTGTWNKTNGVGFLVGFNLGRGSGFDTTADAWQTTTGYALASTSSDVEWIGTSSATFYITGIQLEVGETATPFDHSDDYSTTLAKCQRYCVRWGGDAPYERIATGQCISTSGAFYHLIFPTTMRAVGTLDRNGCAAGNSGAGVTAISTLVVDTNSDATHSTILSCAVTSAAFRAGDATELFASNNTDHYVQIDAEL